MGIKLKEKQIIVMELNKVAKASISAVVANSRGTNVKTMNDIRKDSRTHGVYIKIIRNTLAKQAVIGTQFDILNKYKIFKGPTLLAFSKSHPGAAARILHKFKNDTFALKAAVFNGELLIGAQINFLVQMPTYDEAIIQFLNVLKEPILKLMSTLIAIHEKKQISKI